MVINSADVGERLSECRPNMLLFFYLHAGKREGIIAEKSGGIIARYASHCQALLFSILAGGGLTSSDASAAVTSRDCPAESFAELICSLHEAAASGTMGGHASKDLHGPATAAAPGPAQHRHKKSSRVYSLVA